MGRELCLPRTFPTPHFTVLAHQLTELANRPPSLAPYNRTNHCAYVYELAVLRSKGGQNVGALEQLFATSSGTPKARLDLCRGCMREESFSAVLSCCDSEAPRDSDEEY